MAGRPVFSEESKRVELCDKLNDIPGIAIPPDAIERRPSFRLDDLDDAGLGLLLEVLAWYFDELDQGVAGDTS